MKVKRPERPIDPTDWQRQVNLRLRAEFVAGAEESGASGPGDRWRPRSSSGSCGTIRETCSQMRVGRAHRFYFEDLRWVRTIPIRTMMTTTAPMIRNSRPAIEKPRKKTASTLTSLFALGACGPCRRTT